MNVRSRKPNINLTKLEDALDNGKVDILGLVEIRRLNEAIILTDFLISKAHVDSVISFQLISERIACVKLSIGVACLFVIQVHAPTSDSSDVECENFDELLFETFN